MSGISEDDFDLESDEDFEPASPPPPIKNVTRTPASKKRLKKDESDEYDSEDSELEPVKKTPKATPKSTPKVKAQVESPKKVESKVKEAKAKDIKPKEMANSTAGKDDKPKEILNQTQASEEVAKYMRQTNRPYSVLNVFENLHRRIGKTMLQKILDVLVEKGEINVKTYGKSQIYYYNQAKLPRPSPEALAHIEDQITAASDEVASLEKELKDHEAILHGLNSQLSDAELSVTLESLEAQNATLQAKLQEMDKRPSVVVDPGAKAALTKSFTKYRTEWVKRKRIVMDAIDQIADGMEKKRKDVLDLCGVETDESVGIKEIPVLH
ncbi:hypothetical protein, variant 1 [Aphanomyces invadans]|uniref:Homologous-pairing protein 2 homolog n=1 Tax=Aphanomyces invadans TaxID=157072 RepID=A0A024U6Z6_9STRA|nr:hypothetical protein, variant 1 [Aphanomyces invadans]ETW01363.1 hypothetical protein, variant 1 [Aphanomyces invadans]|eukprot:XP_008870361.1 hypothetical protein, variant 1 [Aphanomyces invadans]